MTISELIALTKSRAAVAGVDPVLACAMVNQESSWDQWAWRYEPQFFEKYVAPLGVNPTSGVGRSCSWGLMQIMGETAREEGYAGPFPLLADSDPVPGLDAGLKHFTKCLERCGGKTAAALQMYNGGRNPNYAADVLQRMAKYNVKEALV